jgi:hypothetical protein
MEFKRKKSTDSTQWSNSFKVGDFVKITEDWSDRADTNKKYTIKSIDSRDLEQIKRTENPSGLIYILNDNGGSWEGKDLEFFDSKNNEDSKLKSNNIAFKSNINIEQKIKELRLLPLFPDMNFNYTSFELDKTGEVIKITDLREEINLRFTISLFYAEKSSTGLYVVLGRVYNYESGEDLLNISEQYPLTGLSDAINKFNFHYEELAKKFNELLLETLKEELEKEKEKAKEEEQKAKEEEEKSKEEQGGDEQDGDEQDGEGQDGEGQDGEGQDGEGQDGEGQDGEGQGGDEQGGDEQGGDEQGGDEQGGDEQGGDEQGGDGKMSSKDIQKLIDQLDNQIDNKDTSGQSNDEAIDLEDFLKKVEEGKVDNDFSKYRNDKGLKAEIDNENQIEPNPLDFLDEDLEKEFDEKQYSPVTQALKEKLKIDDSEIKRRFPTPDFVRDFVFLLGKNEIEDLSNRIGIEKEVSLNDKKSILATNLITELQNI